MSPSQKQKTANDLPSSPYWAAFQGKFFGVLKWEDVDQFWISLADKNSWYINDLDKEFVSQKASPAQFSTFLGVAKTLIDSRRDMSMSGAIYTDNIQSPSFVKIFDPANMGSACNISGVRTMPRWILSQIPPEPMPAPIRPVARSSFIARLLKK